MNLLIILFLTNFIRTLFIIVIVYYGIRFFSRHILPLLVEKGVKNLQQKMHEQQRQQRSARPAGEVTIENKTRNSKTNIFDKGDYVDFEEVE